MQAVSLDQAGKSVRPLKKFIAHAHAPLRTILRRFSQSPHVQPLRVFTANDDGEAVVEPKWRSGFHVEPACIFLFDSAINVFPCSRGLLLQDSRAPRARPLALHV